MEDDKQSNTPGNNEQLDEQGADAQQGIAVSEETSTPEQQPDQPDEEQKYDPSTPTESQPNTQDVKSGFKLPLSRRNAIILLAVILVLVAGVTVLMLFKGNDKESVNRNAGSSSESEDRPAVSVDLSQVNFLDQAEELDNLPVFTEEGYKNFLYNEAVSEDEIRQFKFQKIGTTSEGNDIILARIPDQDMGSDYHAIFIKLQEAYILLAKHSSLFWDDGKYIGPELHSNVYVDRTSTISRLEVKETISYSDITASKASFRPFFLEGDNAEGLTEVATIAEGVVYERVSGIVRESGVKYFSILLRQPSGMYVTYRYTTEILRDDNSVEITWSDGTTAISKYNWAMVSGGCGQVESVNVLDKAYFNDLIEIGTAGSEKIYGFKSADHPVVDTVYSNYNFDGLREGADTRQQFFDNNGVIVVRNKLGYRVILVNDKYQSMGECGKPVIYLYPEKVTRINVKVGANINTSIPEYGEGWDVVALPNGNILNKDLKVYPYLFWEGQGYGKYPEITEGFVIKSQDIEATLRTHLSELGLNQRETADFLEFWLPLMPDTPYIRLTWFNTKQMNELAPLSLSVQPDTIIRVFLDFEGLEQPINLKPQRLTHPERRGFVLVEWGGLRYVY